MHRRHLQFLLPEPLAAQAEGLRQRWDPVMAARAPAHISLVYPEEHDDEALLLMRTLDVSRQAAPLVVDFAAIAGDDAGRGGVWFPVATGGERWNALRSVLLAPPFQLRSIPPHVTIVHPRTSDRGVEALPALADVRLHGAATLDEILHTETSPGGTRVLQRFRLQGHAIKRMVGALLRSNGRILLCHRSRHRAAYPGVWDLPGGHREAHESAEQTLLRELAEELGITAAIPAGGPWRTLHAEHIQLELFIIDAWRGEPENRAPDEHEELRWMTPAELSPLPVSHPQLIELVTQALRA